jgi:hypothetical protein
LLKQNGKLKITWGKCSKLPRSEARDRDGQLFTILILNYLKSIETPLKVVSFCGSFILLYQILHNISGIIELVQVLSKNFFFTKLIQESLSLTQFVVLLENILEKLE